MIGACAGSTGRRHQGRAGPPDGQVQLPRELFKALHPKVIKTVKLNGIPVKDEIISASVMFFGLYLMIFFIASLMLSVLSYGDHRWMSRP